MGNKFGKKPREREKRKFLEPQPPVEVDYKKIILLGAGETGKSTFFKQIVYKHNPLPDHERKQYIPCIIGSVIQSMSYLVAYVKKNNPSEEELALLDQATAEFTSYNGGDNLAPTVVALFHQVWQLHSIQLAYTDRGRLQLHVCSTLPECLETLKSLNNSNYLPSLDEIVRTRIRTTGIIENEIELDGQKFRLFDVGGQREERKKWIHTFENVSCVVFFAALGAFDESLFEDESTMRLNEDLTLWDEIVNSRWFTKTQKCLVFSKMDVFYKKHQPAIPFTSLQQITLSIMPDFPSPVLQIIHAYLAPVSTLSKCFPDYVDANQGPDEAAEFVKNKFLAIVHDSTLVDCTSISATNAQQCEDLFKLVQNITRRNIMTPIGLMTPPDV